MAVSKIWLHTVAIKPHKMLQSPSVWFSHSSVLVEWIPMRKLIGLGSNPSTTFIMFVLFSSHHFGKYKRTAPLQGLLLPHRTPQKANWQQLPWAAGSDQAYYLKSWMVLQKNPLGTENIRKPSFWSIALKADGPWRPLGSAARIPSPSKIAARKKNWKLDVHGP